VDSLQREKRLYGGLSWNIGRGLGVSLTSENGSPAGDNRPQPRGLKMVVVGKCSIPPFTLRSVRNFGDTWTRDINRLGGNCGLHRVSDRYHWENNSPQTVD